MTLQDAVFYFVGGGVVASLIWLLWWSRDEPEQPGDEVAGWIDGDKP